MSRPIDEPCVECATKHLRAALAYAMSERSPRQYLFVAALTDPTVESLVSRAFVLLGEAANYPSHLDLAIGLLVRAEDEASAFALRSDNEYPNAIRNVRLAGSPAVVMGRLVNLPYCSPWYGHMLEAQREWPELELPEALSPAEFVRDFEDYIGQVCPSRGKEVKGDGDEEGEEGREGGSGVPEEGRREGEEGRLQGRLVQEGQMTITRPGPETGLGPAQEKAR